MKRPSLIITGLLFVQLLAAQQGPTTDIHLNMGGPDVYHDNETFEGDAAYPAYYGNSNTYSIGNGQAATPPSIFHTERYGTQLGGTLSYTVPVPNGTYTVKTHHGELYFGKHPSQPDTWAGQRVYDISVEGNTTPGATGFDLYTANENNPYTHTFDNISVNDGVLNLEFDASVQRPQVCGIAIEGPNGNFYVNTGSADDVDFNGKLYIGDQDRGYGQSQTYENSLASGEALFQTERFSSKSELSYRIPVTPNQSYTVKTHHNELWYGHSGPPVDPNGGQRVYDIHVENASPVMGFDLKLVSNNAPHTETFQSVWVADGILDIDLVKVEENPTISGISIEGPGTNIYINAGGGQDVGYGGKTYLTEDKVFVTDDGYAAKSVAPLSGIFDSERFGPLPTSSGGLLAYTIPVNPAETYTVKTHHNELYFGVDPSAPAATSNQRIYGISVEGSAPKVLDLYVENGNMPYTHTVDNVTVGSDGILNIDLTATTQRAQISGISVIGSNGTEIYINTGSASGHEMNGTLFAGEIGQGYSPSNTFTNNSASTEDLFKTERYKSSSGPELSYGIALPNGTYTVKTHHNELWFGKHGSAPPAGTDKREFDIVIEGAMAHEKFNLAALNLAESKPIGDPRTEDFTGIQVQDGVLNIDLVKGIDNPNISGISIEQTSGGNTALYINAGGGSVTYDNKTYVAEADLFIANSSNLTTENTITAGNLFESERYVNSGDLDITIPLENAVYTVKTYHSENWFGVYSSAPPFQDDHRMFDIEIEGAVVQAGFDLYDYSVNGEITPTVRTFPGIQVTDGQLDLSLKRIAGKDNPNLFGLSIVYQGELGQEGDETPLPYAPIGPGNENYILTRSYQKGMAGFSPVNEHDVIEEVAYFDGLGRPMQQVAAKAGQDANGSVRDIVTHIGYDAYGRMKREWLPYGANGPLGSFRAGAEGETDTYYTQHYAADLDAAPNPFAEKDFEPSPLNRVVEQAAPGKDWKLGSGHGVRFAYETNDATEVLRFDVTTGFADNTYTPTLVANGNYGAGELFKNVTKDENWTNGKNHTTEEFTDKRGRVVLKRTYADLSPFGGDTEGAHDTHYVYDDFGNLAYVIPPKVDASNGVSTTELDELCYQYVYDHRNRLVEKKLPGKGWEHIVYDKLDRPIMTKDAENPWLFTRYDAFGRVAFTGLANGGTRTAEQGAADGHAVQWAEQSGTAATVDGSPVYYNGGGYPAMASVTELHTINYYDDYNLARDGIAKPTGTILGQAQADDVTGLATVNRVRVLDPSAGPGQVDWIGTLTVYDEKRRAIFTRSENEYLGTVDIVQTELDQAGKAVKTETSHQRGADPAIVTIDKFDYDHAARLLKQRQEIDGKTEMIAFNSYDGIGRLAEKKVGNLKADPLQTVDYGYNIRGWLKSINDPSNLGDDLFAFGVNYNTVSHGGTALFNGNISETEWKTANTDNSLKWYKYEFDALNRLTGAIDNTADQRYGLMNVSYDKNGNVTSLARKGHLDVGGNTFGNMDLLGYVYDSGNKVLRIDDSGNDAFGFRDGTNTGDDFGYDSNGNLEVDRNKGINSITYNHLNMPTLVDFGATGNIAMVYAADGTKLKKTASNGTVTEYANGHVYEGGQLQFFNHAEGYVHKDGNDFKYVYQFRDHVDNIRLSYTDNNGTLEIVEENNFYPFGGKMRGYNTNVSPLGNSTAQRWKFGGMELDESLDNAMGTYDFGARIYDEWGVRWWNIDPEAEKMRRHSPYNYAFNNPVFFLDPDGMMPCPTGDCPEGPLTEEESIKSSGSARPMVFIETDTKVSVEGFRLEGKVEGEFGKAEGSLSGFGASAEFEATENSVKGGAEVHGLEAEAELRAGTEDNNIAVEGEGSAFKANADFKAGVHTGKDGKFGVELGANAKASALNGSVTPSVSIFGVKVGVTIGGSLGSAHIGADGTAIVDTKNKEFDITAQANIGLGAGLKVGFTVSNTKQKIHRPK